MCMIDLQKVEPSVLPPWAGQVGMLIVKCFTQFHSGGMEPAD